MVKAKMKSLWQPALNAESVEFTKTELMLKLIATIDPDGYPRITLITSNFAPTPEVIKWGQFSNGLSKRNVHENPKQGFFYMTKEPPFRFMRAKASFEFCSDEGDDALEFNKTAMLRYNTYMHAYRTFYNKVIAAEPIQKLSVWGITKGIFMNLWAKWNAKTGDSTKKLPLFGKQLLGSPFVPKFIAMIDPNDEYPVIIPAFQVRAVEWSHLVFPYPYFKEELLKITKNTKIAVYGLNLETMSLLVQGTFLHQIKSRGISYGIVSIDKIYNGMPPKMGYIYPNLEIKPKIESFT